MNPTYDFKGQVALVTGASSGMGLATAQAFAQAGAAVVLADINEKALGGATDGLATAGHQAIGVICDVSNEDQVAALVERAGQSTPGLAGSEVDWYRLGTRGRLDCKPRERCIKLTYNL